jgi:hypothetical protein
MANDMAKNVWFVTASKRHCRLDLARNRFDKVFDEAWAHPRSGPPVPLYT